MPNRILRDYTDSESMAAISAQSERLFIRLIQKADDYGNYHANPALIRSGCFPLMLDTVREADISRDLAACEKAGLIALYEASEKKFLNIKNFNQRMRNSRPKYPLPSWQQNDGPTADKPTATRRNSPQLAASRRKSPPESETDSETDSETNTPQPPTGGEQPEGGTAKAVVLGEDGFDPIRFPVMPDPSKAEIEAEMQRGTDLMAQEEEFNVWFDAYPKQTDRHEAARQWLAIRSNRPNLDTLLDLLEAQKSSSQWTRDEGRFVPNPAAYLSGRKWEDKLTAGKKPKTSPHDF